MERSQRNTLYINDDRCMCAYGREAVTGDGDASEKEKRERGKKMKESKQQKAYILQEDLYSCDFHTRVLLLA